MNKLFYSTLLTLFLFSSGSIAQIKDSTSFTQTIKGVVSDKNSKLTLPGVTVKITSMQPFKGTATNVDGKFRLGGVPVGRHTIEFTYTGYKTVVLSEILVTTGKEAEVNIDMEPISKELNEVLVSGAMAKRPLNEMAMSSGRSFSPEETNRYGGH